MFRIPHMFRDRGMFAPGGGAPFGLSALQADSNCILIQDPSQVWGVQDFLPRRNLLLATDTLATQNVAVVATAYKLYCQGTGSITLSGTATGTLNGTGANDRVSLSFTPTAGTLTLTVSGTVTYGMLCRADTLDQSYQKITDWTTEQYAWAAQKNVPWLRRNFFTNTGNSSGWQLLNSGTGVAPLMTFGYTSDPDGGNNATRIQLNKGAGDTASDYSWAQTAISVDNPHTYYISFYVKSNSGTPTIRLGENAGHIINVQLTTDWQLFNLNLTTVSSSSISLLFSLRGANGNSQTADILVYAPTANPGSVASPQFISATWDATYTANAIAAGYPISLWQDSAGTIAVNGDNQAVGKCVNIKSPGTYDAVQSTSANQPKWRLDANGKSYFERDLVNDAMPVTFPNLGSDCAIYVGNGPTIVESTGQTLNGGYAPITPTPDYGRVVFTSIPAYVAKVRKWLLAKAGY